MTDVLNELLRESKQTIDAARAVHEAGEKDKRKLTDEENAKYNALMDKHADIKARIQREESLREVERNIATNLSVALPSPSDPKSRNIRASAEFTSAFARMLHQTDPRQPMRPKDIEILNALQADSDEAGGYTVVPEQFMNTLIKAIDDSLYIRKLGLVIPLAKAASLGAVSLDADPEDGAWGGEITAADPDTQMDFGKREMTPSLCTKLLKVSKKLVRVSSLDITALIIQRLAYKFSVTLEKNYLTGTGSAQPLGVFTASANGIATARDMSTDNTTTAITMNGLINAKYHLKEGYQRNSDWIFHRDAVKMIAKLVDGNGQYLWRESVRVGEPDVLLGRPAHMSEYAPNTFTTGLYVGIIGDFKYFWIVDALDMAVQVVLELYAETHQNGYIARYEGDAMPVLGEAFARVKLG